MASNLFMVCEREENGDWTRDESLVNMHFSKLLYMYQNQINTPLLYMSRTVTFFHASYQRRRGINLKSDSRTFYFECECHRGFRQRHTHGQHQVKQIVKQKGRKISKVGQTTMPSSLEWKPAAYLSSELVLAVEHGDGSRLRQHRRQSHTLCFGSGPPLHGGADAGLFLSPPCLLSFEDQKDCDSNKSSKAPTK